MAIHGKKDDEKVQTNKAHRYYTRYYTRRPQGHKRRNEERPMKATRSDGFGFGKNK
jgi:hypothetical protein